MMAVSINTQCNRSDWLTSVMYRLEFVLYILLDWLRASDGLPVLCVRVVVADYSRFLTRIHRFYHFPQIYQQARRALTYVATISEQRVQNQIATAASCLVNHFDPTPFASPTTGDVMSCHICPFL